MKLLFYGEIKGNVGPANINKGIIGSMTDSFRRVTVRGKYREMIAAFWQLLRVDVLVVSGVSRKACILVGTAKMLGKPSVYIMHGCAVHEWALNNRQPDKQGCAQEAFLLKHADLLLPVSEKFMHWVHQRYPQYASKTKYLTNGIDPTIFRENTETKRHGSVAVSGGLSPLKNNMTVAAAVEQLEGKAFLEIYGSGQRGGLPQMSHSTLMGKVPHEDFLGALSRTSLFVLNSRFESFSIAAVEALACGCSVLLSECAGVTGILALEETDIIHDPMDVEEIRGKIEYLLDHPNNERILAQFDVNEWSFDKMVQRLEKECESLLIKKNKHGGHAE